MTDGCQVGDCEDTADWTWHDGKWAGGRYCATHIRAKLPSESDYDWPSYRDPITTEETVTRLRGEVAIIPAGAQPRGSSFPTIRSQEAFDEYLETAGGEADE